MEPVNVGSELKFGVSKVPKIKTITLAHFRHFTFLVPHEDAC